MFLALEMRKALTQLMVHSFSISEFRTRTLELPSGNIYKFKPSYYQPSSKANAGSNSFGRTNQPLIIRPLYMSIPIPVKIERLRKKRLDSYETVCRKLLLEDRITFWQGSPNNSITSTNLVLKTISADRTESIQKITQKAKIGRDTRHLIMLGIPLEVTPFELLQGCLHDFKQQLAQVRIVRIEQLQYYGLLLEFRDTCVAFHEQYMGKSFWILDDELIILREVKSVHVDYAELSLLAFLANQLDLRPLCSLDSEYLFQAQTLQTLAKNMLPQCSICHGQLPSEQPSITSICLHTFHASCLQNHYEKESGCPSCGQALLPKKLSFCEHCCEYEDVWMCIQCFERVCAPGDQPEHSHAHSHFRERKHTKYVSLNTLELYSFGKSNDPNVTAVGMPRMNKKEFLRECIRMQTQRIKQQMAVEDRHFEAELLRIPKQSEQRLATHFNRYLGLLKDLDELTLCIWEKQEVADLESELNLQRKVKALLTQKVSSIANQAQEKGTEILQLEAKINDSKQKLKELEMRKTREGKPSKKKKAAINSTAVT